MDEATDDEIRQEMRQAKLMSTSTDQAGRIYRAVNSISTDGKIFYMLTFTPEQFSDVIRVLVDGDTVVAFELSRSDPDAPAEDVMVYAADDYMQLLGDDDFAKRELRAAAELTAEEIGLGSQSSLFFGGGVLGAPRRPRARGSSFLPLPRRAGVA